MTRYTTARRYEPDPQLAPILRELSALRLAARADDLGPIRLAHVIDLRATQPGLSIPTNIPRLMSAMRRGVRIPPIVVDEETGDILDGHHRYHASRMLGYTEIPVRHSDTPHRPWPTW